MNKSWIDLSNHLGVFLLFIIPALINLGIFIYAIFFLPQNRINRAFFLFVLLLGIAQTGGGIMRLNISEELARELPRMFAAALIFALSFGLLFVLRFTGWSKKIEDSKLFLFLFLGPILFNFIMIARLDKYIIIRSEQWNWIVVPEPTLISNSIYLWITGVGLITLVLLWIYYFKRSRTDQKKMQSLMLAVGYTIPFVGGSITEIIFPFILHLDTIPLTAPLITAFSITSLVAIKKYNMLDYSPRHQWDNIIETMNEGLVIVNNDCRIMYANELFCEQVEYEFKAIKEKNLHELLMGKYEQEKLTENVIEGCKNNKLSQNEIQVISKSGKKIWMLIARSPYVASNGNVIGSIVILTDISERKQSEDMLKLSNQELETFIYKASHDLRAPLASILGLINVSKLDVADEKSLQYLNMIDTSAKRLDNILIGLVQSMNIKDTKKMDEKVDFDLLISETLKKMEHYDGYSRMKISSSVSVRSSYYSSRLIMESVFQNLVENAIKYQNYSDEESFLKITITEKNNTIEAVFEDNGIGIDPVFHKDVFEMYFKAHSESKGSGLGLYLVNIGVKKLDGKVMIDSEKCKGTKFTISLPIKNN